MQKRKNRKHSLSEKIEVIKDYQSGYGSTTISNRRKIADSLIKRWIRTYQAHGIEGLQKQSRATISAHIKQQAVKEIIEECLSFETVALKYHVSISAVYSWFQRVKEHGYASLLTIKQGRPTELMGRPKKKQPETELEKLQAELRYLRAENALLKKLKALEEERTTHENARLSKPSKR
ncbi:MAG: transposase [Bacteroidales bacterium]